ncbi:MAG: head decoration protein [Sphingomonas pseudosanguinis]|uniref:head decoration protein n=1 Tax=Sphingomonas pseudosanguinis TaxID=413712 RepID=UPI00391DCD4B
MALNSTPQGNSPFQPGVSQEVFVPDQLIGGDMKLVTRHRQISGGAIYKRGTVLGVITATGVLTIATAAANDGSQTPAEILADDVDATGGTVAGGTYVMGEFNERAVILGAGITIAAARTALELKNIYLKSSVSAALPS